MGRTETATVTDVEGVPSFELLEEVDIGGLKVAVVRAALELDVFGLVNAGVGDEAGLAASIGASRRGIGVLVRALCSLGLLEREDGRLRCSASASAYLVPESTTSAAAIHLAWLRRRDRLVDAIRSGEPLVDHADGDRADEWRSYAAPDLVRWPEIVPDLVQRFTERGVLPAPGERILDLGCGSGIVGLAMASVVPGASVTAVDRAEVLDVTRNLASAMGLAERTTVIAGDVVTWRIEPSTYDLVLLVNVAQYLHDDALVDLLRRCRDALRACGRVYLSTPLVDDGTPGHDVNWATAVEMYLNTAVDQRDEPAVLALFARAGWTDVRRTGPFGFVATHGG